MSETAKAHPCEKCGAITFDHERPYLCASCMANDADPAEPTNADRAARGRMLIDAYAAECGMDESNLCDALADLMHMAPGAGWDFNAELERARMHYEEEREK